MRRRFGRGARLIRAVGGEAAVPRPAGRTTEAAEEAEGQISSAVRAGSMQSPCPSSSERPAQLSYMEVLRYHELCQTLYGGPLLTGPPWLPLSTSVSWTEPGQTGQLAAPPAAAGSPPPAPCPVRSPAGDCSGRPAAQEANTGRGRISDFSIEGILAGARTAESATEKEPEYDWLNCTRYKPPKLPRKL